MLDGRLVFRERVHGGSGERQRGKECVMMLLAGLAGWFGWWLVVLLADEEDWKDKNKEKRCQSQ